MPPALHSSTRRPASASRAPTPPPAHEASRPSDRRFSFVGRQPILDRHGRVAAHDLLFRDAERATEAHFESPLAATAQVLLSTFADLGPESLLGRLPGFVNADPKLEIALHLEALPEARIVFDVPPGVVVDDTLIERMDQIRAAGFELCLDDYEYRDPREALLPWVRYVKVDFSRHTAVRLRKIARDLDAHGGLLRIACRIETERQHRIFEEQGWSLAQGYAFAHPELVARNKPSIRRSRLLDLLGRIDESTSADELANHLKRVPHLTMNVLSMANLVRSDPGQRIESVQQAVVMLGRGRLMRWLHLLLFSSDEPNGCADPLCQLSSVRGSLMESLAAHCADEEADPDRAALAGLLSLSSALLGLQPREVCRKLALDYSVEKALLRREGVIGRLLALIEAREARDFAEVDALMQELGLAWSALEQAELRAIEWSEELSGLRTVGSGVARVA